MNGQQTDRFVCVWCRFLFDAQWGNDSDPWEFSPECQNPKCTGGVVPLSFYCPLGERGRMVLRALDAYRNDHEGEKLREAIKAAKEADLPLQPDAWKAQA